MSASLSTIILLVVALVTLGSAAIALAMKNIIRAALLLVLSWVGIAAFYLWAGAEFVSFAQILVYVGAISMIVLFGVVLTRRTPVTLTNDSTAPSMRALAGIASGGLVALAITWGILGTDFPERASNAQAPDASMRNIGFELMGRHSIAVLIVGALLTVALLGSIILAAHNNAAGDAPKTDNTQN